MAEVNKTKRAIMYRQPIVSDKNLFVNEDLDVKGSVKAAGGASFGSLNIVGNVEAQDMKVLGNFEVQDNAVFKDVVIKGNLKVEGAVMSSEPQKPTNVFEDGHVYFGDPEKDGTWRVGVNEADFHIEQKVAGQWSCPQVFMDQTE